MESIAEFFSTSGFMPHGHCYLWRPLLLWTHFFSDLLIGIAYIGISFLLYGLVKRIQLPFSGMFIAFGAFIAFCGATHLMAVWNLWHSDYWLSALIKVVTAVASVATWVILFPVKPKIIETSEAARLSNERKLKLEEANKELESLYEKIKEADRLKTQFFANVSHELRTPLALILGPATKLASDASLSAEQRKDANVMLRNSKTLLKQVNDLLDLSKIEAGRLAPDYEEMDLSLLLRGTCAHFENIMQTKNIRFSLKTPKELKAQIDPQKMQRVFMNLLSNAVKFTPEDGEIKVVLKKEKDGAAITFEDTGTGVDPAQKEKIFERFIQGEGGINRRFGGTGLGLAIVKDFVDMHKGSIELTESKKEYGSTFKVWTPLKAPERAQIREHMKATAEQELLIEASAGELIPEHDHPSELSQALGKDTVLVCEDNQDMRDYILDILEDNFNVVGASDGREGLEKARALSPDLIISDIMMPNMGGDELLKELKKDESLANVPVLLLSARADNELKARLLQEGASDYVVKPFEGHELLARAKNLVTLKKTREVLIDQLQSTSTDLVELAKEAGWRKREAEIAREASELAREEAEKANLAKSAFLSLASHELNTPITSLYLNLELLQMVLEAELSEENKNMLIRALSSAKNLKDLVQGLLEYTRVESSSFTQEKVKIDLEELATGVIEELKVLADKKGLPINLHSKLEGEVLRSDPRLVRAILNNLLSNAIKYTEEGKVDVSFWKEEDKFVISVLDTGAGISKEDQARIFDEFKQLEPLAQKTLSGLGLGLALVKRILEGIGGDIHLDSSPGKGSEFKVYIPSK